MEEVQKTKFSIIKRLSERTGLSVKACKTALDNSDYDVNSTILWLRTNKFIQPVSIEKLLKQCGIDADEMALDFIETTTETGELQRYYSNNDVETIQDNFFYMFLSDFITISSDELKLLTDEEMKQLDEKRFEYYNEAVKKYLTQVINK